MCVCVHLYTYSNINNNTTIIIIIVDEENEKKDGRWRPHILVSACDVFCTPTFSAHEAPVGSTGHVLCILIAWNNSAFQARTLHVVGICVSEMCLLVYSSRNVLACLYVNRT